MVDSTDFMATQVVLAILSLVSMLSFGFITKNSLVRFSKKMSEEEKQSVVLGTFISPIHAIGVMYHVFLMVQSFSLLFLTDWIATQNCFLVKIFTYVSASLAKGTQYLFFVWRLHVVFEDSSLEVPWTTIRNLLAIVAVAVSSAIGASVFAAVEAGGSSWTGTKVANLIVCVGSGVGPSKSAIWGAVNYLVFDTLIMVIVIYSFVWRLLDLASRSEGLDVRTLAFHHAGLFLFSRVLTWITGWLITRVSTALGIQMLFPVLDTVLNAGILLLLLDDRMKSDWLLKQQWKLEMSGTKVKSESGGTGAEPVISALEKEAASE